MLKKILNTIFTRFLNGILSLLIVILNSKYLGAENVGTISLIMLSITVFSILSNLLSGFIYFTPRENNAQLFFIAYAWTVISVAFFLALSKIVDFIPSGYTFDVVLLSLLFAFSSINTKILAGHSKISLHNLINLIQFVITFAILSFLIFFKKETDVKAYTFALYIAYGITFILSLTSVKQYLQRPDFKGIWLLIKKLFGYGLVSTIANIVQQLSYRISYYFIEYFLGLKPLGQYSVGVQLSESTWILGRSIAFVQFTHISNNADATNAKNITILFAKLSFLIGLLSVTALLSIPESWYLMLFSKDFSGLKITIAALSEGIVALSVSFILSHYFAGLGKPKYNMYASLIGFAATVIFGLILIPNYGLIGAGFTACASYTISLVVQIVIFFRISKSNFKEFLITKNDILMGKQIISGSFNRKKS